MELHHTKSSIVTGRPKREKASLEDVQKFFPKVATDSGGEDSGPSTFTDSIADSLDDAQAELLVSGQAPSTVCARDIAKFCGKSATKSKHPLHCLGLLSDEETQQIHKLCKVHVENSITFTCAKDIDALGCDPVMQSTMECLSEDMSKISVDCADQVKLVKHVVAKVNNAHVHVTDGSDKKYKILNERDETWSCPEGFSEKSVHGGCCNFAEDSECNFMGSSTSKYSCVRKQCTQGLGRWLLKNDGQDALYQGHLCCAPPKMSAPELHQAEKKREEEDIAAALDKGLEDKSSLPAYADPGKLEDSAPPAEESGPPLMLWFVLAGAVAYWQRELVAKLLMATTGGLKDVSQVDVPGVQAVELTTFFNNLFGVPKNNQDDLGLPMEPDTFKQPPRPVACGGYGGL